MGFFLGLVLAVAAVLAANLLLGDRQAAWLMTFAAFSAAFVATGWTSQQGWRGIFVNSENRISLARLQLLVWSAVILSALTAAGLQNVFGPHPKPDPLDIAIPEVIWGLLGLGSFTLVAAAQIAGGNRSQQPLEVVPQSDGTTRIENGIVVNLRPKDANWSDLVTGEGTQAGQVEIAKLQKLAITLLLVCVYFSDLYRMFGSGVPIESFPAVSAGMVALIGISDATFLVNKQFSAFRYREAAGAHRSIDAQDDG